MRKSTTKVLSIAAAKYFCSIAKNLTFGYFTCPFQRIPTHTAMLMAEKLSIPFTFTAHASDIFVNPSDPSLKKRMEQALAIMTPSYYNKKYLHELTGISETKICVIRACPIIDKFKVVKANPSIPCYTYSRSICRKKRNKKWDFVNESLSKFYPEIQYRIIGSGVLENELKLSRILETGKKLYFLGNINDDSQLNELGNATIFILPCLEAKNGDMDGIPVSLMEAMYLRIPIVSTSISGIPELIQNGKEGLIVEPGNIGQIVNAIKFFLKMKTCELIWAKEAGKKLLLSSIFMKKLEKW